MIIYLWKQLISCPATCCYLKGVSGSGIMKIGEHTIETDVYWFQADQCILSMCTWCCFCQLSFPCFHQNCTRMAWRHEQFGCMDESPSSLHTSKSLVTARCSLHPKRLVLHQSHLSGVIIRYSAQRLGSHDMACVLWDSTEVISHCLSQVPGAGKALNLSHLFRHHSPKIRLFLVRRERWIFDYHELIWLLSIGLNLHYV